MTPLEIGMMSVAALLMLLATGVPVAAALGVVGLAGMLLGAGPALTIPQLKSLPFAVVNNYELAVLPMFVLMGTFAEASGITTQLFQALQNWLGRLRGGLYQATVLGSAVFAAVSGSTIVNAVVFTRVAYPEMVRHGYDRSFSIGCIAATGSFAAMIPPSITMVIYAIMTEQSVGRLLMAGLIPGLLTAVVYLIGIAFMVRLRPGLAPPLPPAVSLATKLRSAAVVWPLLFLIGPVLAGLYSGLYPASAAGAIGAFLAFLVAVSRRRSLRGWLGPALADATAISCTIFAVLIGGLLLSRMLVVTGVIDELVVAITTIADTPISFMVLVCLLFLVLGSFLDTTSMMVVTLPFLFPVSQKLGIDPIWFGIVVVKLIEISVVTPPVGVNLFAVLSATDERTEMTHVMKGVAPFIGLELIVLAVLVAFPALSTWLPQQMIR